MAVIEAAEKSSNVTWQSGFLGTGDRERLLGGRGAVVWFTGLSGSGKSTIAQALEHLLVQKGRNAFVLDGDNIRQGLNRDLGFSPADRKENIRRIGEVAGLFSRAGIVAITAFISPYREDRALARRLAPEGRFFEVYLDAPVEACEARDVKGLYKKARAGLIPEFTGISAPYEAPESPDLVLATGREPVPQSAAQLVVFLKERGIV